MKNWNTPLWIVIVVATVVLGTELLLMELLHEFLMKHFNLPDDVWAVIDAVTLTAILSPTLYFLVFRKMREHELRFQKISTAVQDAIVIINEQGRITDWNRAAQQMFQYSRKEALEQALHSLIAPPRYHADAARGFDLFQETGDGPVVGKTIELAARRKDGSEFPIELSLSALRINDCWHAIGIIRDTSERKQAVDALRQSRHLLQTIVENTPIRVFWKDRDLRYLGCNTLFAKDAGRTSPDELIGKTDFELAWKDQAELYRADDQAVIASGKPKLGYEEPQTTPDGNTIWLRTSKVPLYEGDNQIIGVLGIYEDITECKQAEDAVEREQHRLEAILSTSGDGIHILDAEGLLVDANGTFLNMLGYDRTAIGRMHCYDWDAQLGEEIIRGNIKKLMTGHEPMRIETKHRRSDGGIIDVDINARSFEFGGQCYICASSRDITGHNQSERALRESEARLNLALEAARIGIWDWDVKHDLWYATPTYFTMLGYEPEEGPSDRAVWLDRSHPDDREVVSGKIGKVLCGSDAIYQYEARVRHADGAYRWVSVWGKTVANDETGRASRLRGVRIDITERKLMEQGNLEANARTNKALEDTIIAIAATLEQRDPYTAGHQRRVAELACAIGVEMGLPAEVIKGLHFGSLIHDIGKVSVPTEILAKPGHITSIELDLIKTHAEVGYEIIKGIAFPWPVADMVYQHHEHLDGSGYPQGLKGDQIRLEARILAVADVVEAMSANRPYRPGLGLDEALNEIMRCRGTQLDPEAVDACLRLVNEQGFVFSKE